MARSERAAEAEQPTTGVGSQKVDPSNSRPSVLDGSGGDEKPAEIMLVDETADYLRIPKATLYQWRYNGTGPRSIKVGRHVRYRRCDVDAWLEENASPGTAA